MTRPTAARAVALAHALPTLRDDGRDAARGRLAELADPAQLARLADAELAGLLADAAAMARIRSVGSAARAAREAAELARAAVDALPPGRLAPELAERAVAAAGSEARLRHLAAALDGPAHRADTARWTAWLATPAGRHAALDELRGHTELSGARTAALTRAAAAVLDLRRPELAAATAELAERLAAALSEEPAVDPVAAPSAVRERLRAAADRRTRRAARLADRLRSLAHRSPADPAAPAVPRPPADPVLLAWLREHTHPGLYTEEFEAELAAWYGTDPFRLRELPPPPPFLHGTDPGTLPPEHLAPLLRRLSLTRSAPSAEELTPRALERDRGRTADARRSPELRGWGRPPGPAAPPLPELTRIPYLVHGIWLGGPLPAESVFRHNFGRAAQQYAGELDFVLWTDLPRALLAEAAAEPAPPGATPLAEVRSMLDWARAHGVHLIDLYEVFHAGAPMRLHLPFVLETAKQLPRGHGSASDHLRVDIVARFGGAYVDGDMVFAGALAPTERLTALIDRVAAARLGFTMNPGLGVGNDVIVAPARHPALALWSECARLNYGRSQPEIFGGLDTMAQPFVARIRQDQRYLAPHRSGRIHHEVLRLLGLDVEQLPPTKHALTDSHEVSWARPIAGGPATPRRVAPAEAAGVLARCVTFLRWQLIAREGDLYLSAVDPVIRRLPDPDAGWLALLTALPEFLDGLPPITSVTDLRRRDGDGLPERVDLPPEAEALLDRAARPGRWIGARASRHGEPVWLLDERVAPAALRPPAGPLPDLSAAHTALAEAAFDPFGRLLGLWIRPERAAGRRRADRRFAEIAPGRLRLALGSAPSLEAIHELGVRAETVALMLCALEATGRAVELAAPIGGTEALRPFAGRLAALLGQPVTVVEQELRAPEPGRPDRPLVPAVHHLPVGPLLSG
ncbi:hypothetical protein AB0K43_24125 [Kitasatospora sp. NPDC049258]|uniref:hypothetical protein n=1 Tax=Kitasatospora sp. NPDC049258 TaxID=3155394 RepID=UPI0034334202